MSCRTLRLRPAGRLPRFAAHGARPIGASRSRSRVDPNDPRVGLKPGAARRRRRGREHGAGLDAAASRPGFFDPKNPAGEAMPAERRQRNAGRHRAQHLQPARRRDLAPQPDGAAGRCHPAAQRPRLRQLRPRVQRHAHGRSATSTASTSTTSRTPKSPTLLASIVCPGGQGDVSITATCCSCRSSRRAAASTAARRASPSTVSKERFRGVRIFDITDLKNPKQVAAVQTCRGSHTHTLVTDPKDKENVYVYGSGTGGVRSGEELAGCSAAIPKEDAEHRALQHRRDQGAARRARRRRAIVNRPRIFADADDRAPSPACGTGGDHGPGHAAHERPPTSATTSRCSPRSGWRPAPARATASCSTSRIRRTRSGSITWPTRTSPTGTRRRSTTTAPR